MTLDAPRPYLTPYAEPFKPTALLIRVSTLAQAKDARFGIPNQRAVGLEYAEREGLTVTAEYVDAISGKTGAESREALNRLLNEAHQYKAVVIYLVDRIGRDEEQSHRIVRLLHEAGLEIHATNRGIIKRDLQTGVEILMSAEYVRQMQRRMFWGGLVRKAHAGKPPTGLKKYGYVYDKLTQKVSLHPEQSKVIQRLFERVAKGDTLYQIARDLNDAGTPTYRGHGAWSPGTLTNYLKDPIYKGEYHYGGSPKSRHVRDPIIIPVPAIVTEDLWESVQKRRRGRPASSGRPLVGHLRCGRCGRSMTYTSYANRHDTTYHYYRCNGKSDPIDDRRCYAPLRPCDQLEAEVEPIVRQNLSNPEFVRTQIQATLEQDPATTAAFERLEADDARAFDAWRLGAISAEELKAERDRIRCEREKLSRVGVVDEAQVRQVNQAARSMPLPELLRTFEVTVTVHDDRLDVTI